MKKIEIISHVGVKLKLDNGDVYDSILRIKDDNDNILYSCEYVNVDSSNKYNYKVELEDGEYAGIGGLHRNKYLGILIFDKKYLDKINVWTDFEKGNNYLSRYVSCKYPNPVHNGKKILCGVNIHRGGFDWDWSAGCITIFNNYYDDFLKYIAINEKYIIIKRS